MIQLRAFLLFALVACTNAFLPKRPLANSQSSLASSTTSASTMPEVQVGDTLPKVTLRELVTGGDKPEAVDLLKLIGDKRVAIFGVPGAFTPGCSKSHLPSFMEAQEELRAKGIDLTICVATNDAYTMEVSKKACLVMLRENLFLIWRLLAPAQAWGRTSGGSAAGIRFLADDTGDLTRALGLVKETPVGIRTSRFSLIANKGVVEQYFNAAKDASDTYAPNVLAAL